MAFASLCLILATAIPLHAAGDLQQHLVSLDKAMWTAWGKADGKTFEKLLTKDAVQIVAGSGMLVGRNAIAAEVNESSCELKSFEFQDVNVHRLAPNVAILSYKATQDAVCGDTKLPPAVQSTSIYVRKKGKWRNTRYQETAIE
jgi:uncharacterized protein (TIGR02246 family)